MAIRSRTNILNGLAISLGLLQSKCVVKKLIPQEKNNGFPILDILGYLKNTHKNPKFGRVRQIPIWELGWEFPDWDLSHSPKFGIFVGIL